MKHGSNYTEKQPTSTTENVKARNINDFYNSSIQNGGYYIGRYEAGDSSANTPRKDSSGTTGTLVCKINQEVYNYITQADASAKSQAMYANGFGSGTFSSDLVNSYAWDTAIMFIQTFEKTDYASYNKSKETNEFRKTGMSEDKYCNIHDMSGNALEWTTETLDFVYHHRTERGGGYITSGGYADGCTGYRNISWDAPYPEDDIGFRPLLYVALNA